MTEDDVAEIAAARMGSMPPWSYSSLTAFETCPHRYYKTRIEKAVKEPQTEATIWGNEVHKALELRIKESKPMPEKAAVWEPIAERISAEMNRGAFVFTELKLAITSGFAPTDWYAKNAWARCIVDVGVITDNTKLWSGDFKTGKRKMGSTQLQMSTAMLFAKYPDLETAKASFLWLADDKMDTEEIKKADISEIWRGFLPRVERMERAYDTGKFPVKPSGLCRGWCPVKTCDFYEEKKK